jgi:hypothetical protein
MQASLLDFLVFGTFGSLELGASRSTVEQHLTPPEAWEAAAPDYRTSTIWKYGDIEFHFQNNELTMIFMDDFSVLSGGTKIELDAMGINGSLTCDQAERLLNEANIAYRKEIFPYNDNGVHLIMNVGTVLSFCGEDASSITLHALYLQQVEAATP